MKRTLISLPFLFVMFFPLWAQTNYQSAEQELQVWKREKLSEAEEIAKCRQKKIKYYADKYIFEAYFDKKDLAIGKTVSFTNMQKDVLLSGVLRHAEAYLEIDGILFSTDGKQIYGSFIVSNKLESTEFSLKPHKGMPLRISPQNIDYITWNDHGNPVIISFSSERLFSKSNHFGGYQSLGAPVVVIGVSCDDIDVRKLLLSLSKNVEVVWKDRTFHGTVRPNDVENDCVTFDCLTGVSQYDDGRTVKVSLSNGMLTMTVEHNGYGNKPDEQYTIPAKSLKMKDWWNEKEFVRIVDVLQQERIAKEQEKRREAERREAERKAALTASMNSQNNNANIQSRTDDISAKSQQSSPSKKSESSKSDNSFWTWVIIILIAVAGGWIKHKIDWLRLPKCPRCNNRGTLKLIEKENLGKAGWISLRDKDGHCKHMDYNEWEFTYECKICGHQCTESKLIRKDGVILK